VQTTKIDLLAIKEIWKHKGFSRLWLVGTASGAARWLEVLCFSVFSYQLTNDASLAGLIMGLRMVGVVFAGIIFLLLGSKISGQHVMLLMHGLTGATCSCFFFPLFSAEMLIWLYFSISFLSGMLWSTDFSFRRRMLADRLPERLVVSGMGMDVMSSHATRLVATLLGSLILGFNNEYVLLGLLSFLYFGPGLFLFFEKDVIRRKSSETFDTLGSVLQQARKKHAILTVLLLTPVYNVFVLPYLALIALLFLENFGTSEPLAAMLSSVEGLGALFGGFLISCINIIKPNKIFVVSNACLLSLLIFMSNSSYLLVLIISLFLSGVFSSIYSSMQSTIIYKNSDVQLRSPTLSLMTMFIGLGFLGALNVSWLGLHTTVSNVITIMAIEGIVALLIAYGLLNIIKRPVI